jgi:hypothetical protein
MKFKACIFLLKKAHEEGVVASAFLLPCMVPTEQFKHKSLLDFTSNQRRLNWIKVIFKRSSIPTH